MTANSYNEKKYLSDTKFIIEQNLPEWISQKTNLSETILDLNFNRMVNEVNLVKTILTKVEINESVQIISIGKNKLKETSLSSLVSNFIFEATELGIDMASIQKTVSNINSIANNNENLAAGIISSTPINDLIIKVAPSAQNSVISLEPKLTFEGIGDLFKKNKKIVKGSDTLNYIYSKVLKDYLVIISSQNGDTLTFGSYQKRDGKLKVVRLSDNPQFNDTNNIIVTEIIEEIINSKSKKIEFNRSNFSAILGQLRQILSKNGFYVSPNESDNKWIVFEDGIEEIKEMEDWDFHLNGEEDMEDAGELSPMSITKEKRPNTGMNENMSPQDSKDVTSALGVLSNELVTNPTSKNNPTASSLDKLTPNERDALKKTAPQSMSNSTNLGNLVQNVGKELSSKGDTISKDLQGTNKNKEIIKPYGTEQNTDPNTNSIND